MKTLILPLDIPHRGVEIYLIREIIEVNKTVLEKMSISLASDSGTLIRCPE